MKEPHGDTMVPKNRLTFINFTNNVKTMGWRRFCSTYPCLKGCWYPILTALNVVSPQKSLWAYKGPLDVRPSDTSNEWVPYGKTSVILYQNRYIFKSVNNTSDCRKIVNIYRFWNTINDIRILELLTNLPVHHP